MPQDTLQPSQPENPVPSPGVIQPSSSNVVGSSNSTPQPEVSSGITQPTTTVYGQPSRPMTAISSSQFEQKSNQKPSKWRYFFIVLGILQVVGVGWFFLVMASIIGKPGGEFVAMYLFVTLVPAVGLIALINLGGLPIYMRRHKPHGKGLVFSILSLLVSVVLALFGAYQVYQFRVAVPKQIEQHEQDAKLRQEQFNKDNSNLNNQR